MGLSFSFCGSGRKNLHWNLLLFFQREKSSDKTATTTQISSVAAAGYDSYRLNLREKKQPNPLEMKIDEEMLSVGGVRLSVEI